MRTSLASLKDASPAMELDNGKKLTVELLKLIVEVSRYVEGFRFANSAEISGTYGEKFFGRLKDFARAQFPKTLEDYGKRLKARRDNFREVISIQILRDTHEYSTLQTVVIFSLANDNTERTKRK